MPCPERESLADTRHLTHYSTSSLVRLLPANRGSLLQYVFSMSTINHHPLGKSVRSLLIGASLYVTLHPDFRASQPGTVTDQLGLRNKCLPGLRTPVAGRTSPPVSRRSPRPRSSPALCAVAWRGRPLGGAVWFDATSMGLQKNKLHAPPM